MIDSSRVPARALRVLAAAALGLAVLAPGAAFAVSYPDAGTATQGSVDPGAQVEGATATRPDSSALPFTGGDVAGLAAVGGAAVVIGGLMAHRARRARV